VLIAERAKVNALQKLTNVNVDESQLDSRQELPTDRPASPTTAEVDTVGNFGEAPGSKNGPASGLDDGPASELDIDGQIDGQNDAGPASGGSWSALGFITSCIYTEAEADVHIGSPRTPKLLLLLYY